MRRDRGGSEIMVREERIILRPHREPVAVREAGIGGGRIFKTLNIRRLLHPIRVVSG